MLLYSLLGLALLFTFSEGAEPREDRYKGCSFYQSDGWFDSPDTALSSFMKLNCKKTCGLCNEFNGVKRQVEQCEDRYKGCSSYQSDGWCESADTALSSFMKLNCKKTCGFCNEFSGTKRQVEQCEDRYKGCSSYQSDGWCESADTALSSFMKLNCKKTCGLCNEFKGTERPVEQCEDRYKGCSSYQSDGWCDSPNTALSSFMKLNCKKTCGSCAGVDK